jgi:cytochrome P450 family 142 subfamily A polypeptide 1
MEPLIADLCRRIVDDVIERGECEFVYEVAARLPLLVIAHLLGFEEDAHQDLLHWSDEMTGATNPTAGPEQAQRGRDAAIAFRQLQLQVVAECRAEPRPGLITTLCEAEIDGHRLDDESIFQESLLLLLGGDETSRHVLTVGLLALLERPEQLAALAADLSTLPTAVEELLRWVSPVQNMCRTLTRDVEIHGQRMLEGDQLLLFFPSANRDAGVFAAADVLDLHRDPNPHLAFGWGAHYCLGAALARLELRCMFREVLTRMPDLELAVDASALPRRASNFIVGLEEMPIRFTPGAHAP